MLKSLRLPTLGAMALALAVGSGGLSSAMAEAPESEEPIKLVIMGYSGDNIIMYILAICWRSKATT